jgi:hypothetical protein
MCVGVCVCFLRAQGGAGRCDPRLECALLYYLRSFKKSFITETRSVGMGMGASPLMDASGAPVSKEKVRVGWVGFVTANYDGCWCAAFHGFTRAKCVPKQQGCLRGRLVNKSI